MNANELKIEALKDRLGSLTIELEDKIADYRVTMTQQAQLIEQHDKNYKTLQEEFDVYKEENPAEPEATVAEEE